MSHRARPAARAHATPRAPSRPSPHGSPAPAESTDRLLTRLAWLSAALLGVALLVMALGPHRVGDYFTETDFYGAYAEGARLIQQGRLEPVRYGVVGPGYEMVLGLVGFVVRDLLLAAELLSIAATVATLLLWFHLLARRADVRVAFAALLFMATNPYFFRYGYAATTDALTIAIQAGALFLLLTGTTMRAAAAAGALAGFAFLTRYNSIALLPVGIVVAFAGGGRFDDRRKAALAFAAGFAVLVAPWVAFSLTSGSKFSFQLHHNLAYEVFARSRGIPWDDYQRLMQHEFGSLWDVIARDPAAVFGRVAFNAFDHLRLDAQKLLGWPVAVAAVAGIVLGVRDGALRRLWPVWLAAAVLFVTLIPVFHAERYSLALLPMYGTLAGIAAGSSRWAFPVGPGRRVWLKPALAALALVAAGATSWRVQARAVDQLPVEVLEAGETLRRLAAPGDKVIARKAHIAYHGGVEPRPFPFVKTLPELADYARDEGVRWFYFSWPEAEMRPAFFYLLDTAAVVPGLTPRRVTRPHPAVLYEIGPDFGGVPAWMGNDSLRIWHDTRARLLVDRNNADLLYKLGGIAWTMKRFDQAVEPLETATRLDPGNPSAWLLLGGVRLELGDAAGAEAAFRRAEALAPADPRARIGLGWAALGSGRLQEAAALWRPLVNVTRDRALIARMAEVFARVGDRAAEAEARAALARLAATP